MISIPLIARYWREALFVAFVIPLAFVVGWTRTRIGNVDFRKCS